MENYLTVSQLRQTKKNAPSNTKSHDDHNPPSTDFNATSASDELKRFPKLLDSTLSEMSYVE